MSKVDLMKVGDIATFVRGINFKPTDVTSIDTSGVVGCMRTKNVQEDLDLSDVWAVPEKFVKRPDQILQTGDILISSANSWNLVGKCCWIPKLSYKSSFGGFVCVLRANQTKVDQRYLYQWFSSDRIQNIVRSFGRQTTNISNLDINRCLDMQIPLPPIATQKHIAAILDQAEELRSKRRSAIALLDELGRSVFLEMFGDPVTNPKGWEQGTLGEVATFVGGGTPRRECPEYFKGSICWATSKDMKSEFLDDTQEHITEAAINESATNLVPAGTVLIVVKSKILAHSLPIAITTVPTCFGQDLKGMRLSQEYEIRFVVVALRLGKQWLLDRARGINTEGLTLEHLRAFPLFKVPVQLQQQFAKRMEAIETLKATHRQSLAKLDSLFNSLQSAAFNGELGIENEEF